MTAERLPRLTPDRLDADQRTVYDAIAGGDRAKGVQHFPLTAPDGSLHGPFGIMLHAPGIGAALQELGSTIRYRTGLSTRVREIAILQVATAYDSDFERFAHEAVGRAAGLSEEELAALRAGTFTSADVVEQASAELCAFLLGRRHVDDASYTALSDTLGVDSMIELTTLVGYYSTLAQLLELFAVGAPETTP